MEAKIGKPVIEGEIEVQPLFGKKRTISVNVYPTVRSDEKGFLRGKDLGKVDEDLGYHAYESGNVGFNWTNPVFGSDASQDAELSAENPTAKIVHSRFPTKIVMKVKLNS